MKNIVPLICSLIFSSYLWSQLQANKPVLSDNKLKTPVDSAVSKAAREYYTDSLSVGLSIAILKEGKNYYYNYGETEKGSYHLPDANTYYEIGSISKTFTGLLLAQAVIDKKLALEDDIRKYLNGASNIKAFLFRLFF